jgi:hypothetical protein
MLMNSIANQGSILRWSRDHRVHHKVREPPHPKQCVWIFEELPVRTLPHPAAFLLLLGGVQHVDTAADPHDATKGFWWSHVGWLIWRKPESVRLAGRKVFSDDLYADRVVMFQHRNYMALSLVMCFGLPTLIGARVEGDRSESNTAVAPDCTRDRPGNGPLTCRGFSRRRVLRLRVGMLLGGRRIALRLQPARHMDGQLRGAPVGLPPVPSWHHGASRRSRVPIRRLRAALSSAISIRYSGRERKALAREVEIPVSTFDLT